MDFSKVLMYNNDMDSGWDREHRAGFTIIEVMLFLAISGFLLVGILAGTGAGIARQRYNDSVQNVAQILREQYSAAINVQIPMRDSDGTCLNPSIDELLSGGNKITSGMMGEFFDSNGNLRNDKGRGRTECLVYGVMVTLGGSGGEVIQTSALIGKDIEALRRADTTGSKNYDKMDDLALLKAAGVNNLGVYYGVEGGGGAISNWQCWVRTAGSSASYKVQWDARLQNTAGDNLEATILIIRSPRDGAVRTYIKNSAVMNGGKVVNYADINSRNGGMGFGLLDEHSGACDGTISTATGGGYKLLREVSIAPYLNLSEGDFKQRDLEICVDSGDTFGGLLGVGPRRMIKIAAEHGGHNASAVELIDMDDPGGKNKCQ